MKKFSVVLAAFLGMFIFAGCSDSPQDVVEKWVTAIVDGDVETANEYSTTRTHVLNALMIEMLKENSGKKDELFVQTEKIDNAKVEIDGDNAKVYPEGEKNAITLKKVDGEWKVDAQK